MLRKILVAALLFAHTAFPVSAMMESDGKAFYFRYKAGFDQVSNPDDGQNKDIVASYVGGVGEAFSEKLPMKPEWENDSWRITKGILPSGISFNAASLTFEGVAAKPQANVVVELAGYDTNLNKVGTASATFDFYNLPDKVVNVDFYHHTNQYAADEFVLPQGVVIDKDPTLKTALPPGITFNARYLDGTPTKAGTYPILAIGYDYLSNPVVAFKGRYIVEDGPTFAKVGDDLRKLARSDFWGCFGSNNCAVWHDEPLPKVSRTVGLAKDVRYYVEVKAGERLPGTMSFGNDPYNRLKNGMTYTAYQQASIRLKAIDVDQTVGYSNWFKIGTLGPTEVCQPGSNDQAVYLSGVVGAAFNGGGYKVPTGQDTNRRKFTLVGGTLPDGLTLSSDTGVISGTPSKLQKLAGIKIQAAFPDVENATPIVCGPYEIDIRPAGVKLEAYGLKADYRVGETLDIRIAPEGATIAPFKVQLAGQPVLPAGISFDAASGKLKGIVDVPGNFSASFTLLNGDGRSYERGLAFSAHGNVNVNDVSAVNEIKRYDFSDSLLSVTYDPSTIIDEEKWALNGGQLPEGFRFDRGTLRVYGGTCLPPMRYGPFSIELSDSTGMKDVTNEFYINVTERADLVEGPTSDPLTFAVNLSSKGQKPFSVEQARLAKQCLPISYSLEPSKLPEGLIFDTSTGMISGLPKAKGRSDGYVVTISESGPDQQSRNSNPFSIVVNDPPPIPDISVAKLEGNARTGGGNVPPLHSAAPVSQLVAIRDFLVGYEGSVIFDAAAPLIDGLVFDPATGTISGTANSTFNGTVQISYHDGADRVGKINVPVIIHPYPELASSALSYDLPRHSEAALGGISVFPANDGFYGGLTYSLDSSSDPLPAGLSLNSDGHIVGQTDAASGTSYRVVVAGTSTANAIRVTHAFSLNIVPERKMTLDIKPDGKIWFYIDEQSGQVVSRQWFTPDPVPGGSYVAPVTWSLVDAPDWLKISAAGQVFGTPPGLGESNFLVRAQDSEGHMATDNSAVKVSLSGDVQMTPGGQTITVRDGESFETQVQTVTNVVRPFAFTHSSTRPSSLAFDDALGQYRGRINGSGLFNWKLDVVDADNRTTDEGRSIQVRTIAPLDIEGATFVQNGKQYDAASPIAISFSAAKNVMGKVSYGVVGDVPGTLYYKVYDNDDPSQLATYYSDNGAGGVTSIRQLPGESAAQTEFERLAYDHMVFDTVALTLTGVPSRSGTFSIALLAEDDHATTGYKVDPSDPTRETNNKKQSPSASVVVAPGDDLIVTRSTDSELLYQWTSQPKLTIEASHDAYGRGVTWSKVGGSLPTAVDAYAANKGLVGYLKDTTLRFIGYPSTQGTWSDISYKATDAAGRDVTASPVEFKVGPRLGLQLIASSGIPKGMIVFKQDADLKVTAKNAAYGPQIGKDKWSISGADKLPPGVTFDLDDYGYSFKGTSDVIGTYSGITISATDSKGASATLPLTFKVISDTDPIELNVSNIRTKPGYPIEMQPPFAVSALTTGNTYGAVRFYSNDLPSITGISLNGETGFIDGKVDHPQLINFDLFVTDDTSRVRSKPVTAEVIPYLRVIVPTQVPVNQGTVLSQTVSTDYVLGKVSYAKGGGTWPSGFDVDPKTGTIVSVDAATGVAAPVLANPITYPGLTIRAIDTFGTYQDAQESNAFSIVVKPTTAVPDIANQAKTILGTAGSAIVDWAPKAPNGWSSGVIESGKPTAAWKYQGTVYSANYDLAQYGLTFDSATGKISGTPKSGFIIRDFVITVTSARGDSDSTAPFWIGVAPKEALKVSDAQKKDYVIRVTDTTWKTDEIVLENLVGNATFDYGSQTLDKNWRFDTKTGVFSQIGAISASGKWPVYANAIDEFNRKAVWNGSWEFLPSVTITIPSVYMTPGFDYVATEPGATANVIGIKGTATYNVTGLPEGLSFDPATKTVIGRLELQKYPDGTVFNVTAKVTDDYDGAYGTGNFTITVKTGYLYWRISDNQTQGNWWWNTSSTNIGTNYSGADTTARFQGWGAILTTFYEGSTNVSGFKLQNNALPNKGYNYTDALWGVSGYADPWQMRKDATGNWWKVWKFSRPMNITAISWRWGDTNNALYSAVLNPRVEYSNDGAHWATLWSATLPRSTAIPQSTTCPSTICK